MNDKRLSTPPIGNCGARAVWWILFVLLASGSARAEPSEAHGAVLTLEVIDGKVATGNVIRLTQGDHAQLHWSTDKAIDIHLHGYDIAKSLTPGTETTMVFEAHATGRFPITVHRSPDAHDRPGEGAHSHSGAERTLIYLEVHPE